MCARAKISSQVEYRKRYESSIMQAFFPPEAEWGSQRVRRTASAPNGMSDHDCAAWRDRLRGTLPKHSVHNERFEPFRRDQSGSGYHHGHTWTITFSRKTADASAGQVDLLMWGQPALPIGTP